MVFSACYSATVLATVNFEARDLHEARGILDKLLNGGTLLEDKLIDEFNECPYYDIELADLDVASPGYDQVDLTTEEIADELAFVGHSG